MLSIILLSVACLLNSLAIIFHVISTRRSRLRISSDDVIRANRLQSFFEDVRDNTPKVLEKAKEFFAQE